MALTILEYIPPARYIATHAPPDHIKSPLRIPYSIPSFPKKRRIDLGKVSTRRSPLVIFMLVGPIAWVEL